MKKNSIMSNYIYNTFFQIILLFVPLVTTPYISRTLGVENVGKYSYSLAMVTYFVVLATFGSSTLGQRNIAFFREDKKKLSEAFWNIFCFRLITVLLAIFLYFIYLFYTNSISILTLIMSLNIINIMLDITWFFQGVESFKKIALRNTVVKFISLIFIFSLVNHKDDTWIYALIIIGSTILGNIVMWFEMKSYIYMPEKIKPFDNIKDMWFIFLPTIAVQLYTLLDKSMIGWLTNSDYANGCYEQAEKIEKFALSIVISLGTVILPRIANLYNKNDINRIKKYIYFAYQFTLLLALPIMFGLIAISPMFVPLFLGDGYDDSVCILKVLSILIVIVSLAYITGYAYLIPTKQQNVYTIAVTFSAIVNLMFNSILISKYSAVGAAVSTVIAEFVGCSIQIGYCCKSKQLELSSIFKYLWRYLLSAIIMYMVICGIRIKMEVSMVNLTITIGSGVLIYFILLFILRDPLVLEGKDKFYKNVKKILTL